MFEISVICPESKRLGFELAGLRATAFREPAEGQRLLEAALGDPKLGVVLVDENLLPALSPSLTRRSERSERPLVVSIPMGMTAGAEREYLERVIQRVIGYRVRLS